MLRQIKKPGIVGVSCFGSILFWQYWLMLRLLIFRNIPDRRLGPGSQAVGSEKEPARNELRQTEPLHSPVLQKGNHQENRTVQTAGLPVLPELQLKPTFWDLCHFVQVVFPDITGRTDRVPSSCSRLRRYSRGRCFTDIISVTSYDATFQWKAAVIVIRLRTWHYDKAIKAIALLSPMSGSWIHVPVV